MATTKTPIRVPRPGDDKLESTSLEQVQVFKELWAKHLDDFRKTLAKT